MANIFHIKIQIDNSAGLGKVDQTGDSFEKLEGRADVSFGGIASSITGMAFSFNQVIDAAGRAWDVLSAPLDKFAEFQTEFANVESLGVDNIESLQASVLGLTDAIPKSATALTASLYDVVSAGVDSANQISYLELNAKAAVAGLAETTDSIGLSSAVIKGYGMDWMETESILDQAFMTVKLGQTTFGELSNYMGELAPGFAAFDIQTQEMFGSMATLTGVTGDTGKVTTQLKAILTGLMSPTKELTALAKEYGYATVEQMVKQEKLAGVLKIIKEETGGSAAAMTKLFGSSEAVTGLLALTGSQYDTFIDKSRQMYDATSAMTDAYDIQAATVDNLQQIMENKFDKILIQIGESLTPLVIGFYEFANALMDGIDWDTVMVGLDFLVLVLGTAFKAVGWLVGSIWDLGKALVDALPWDTILAPFKVFFGLIEDGLNWINKLIDGEDAHGTAAMSMAGNLDGATTAEKAYGDQVLNSAGMTSIANEQLEERNRLLSVASGWTGISVNMDEDSGSDESSGKIENPFDGLQTPDEFFNLDVHFSDSVEAAQEHLDNLLESLELFYENGMVSEDEYYQKKNSLLGDYARTFDKSNADEYKKYLKYKGKQRKADESYQSKKKKLESDAAVYVTQLTGDLMSSAQGHNKTLFEMGKGLSFGMAMINTAEGITKAIAAGNYAKAIAVGISGGVQIAKIVSTTFTPKAFMGGHLGTDIRTVQKGNYGDGEDLLIYANSGEYIVNAEATAKNREILDYINHFNVPVMSRSMAGGGAVDGSSPVYPATHQNSIIDLDDLEDVVRNVLDGATIKMDGDFKLDNGDLYLAVEQGEIEINKSRVS